MTAGSLTPTLASIERGLFGPAETEREPVPTIADPAPAVPMGPALQALIARRAASAEHRRLHDPSGTRPFRAQAGELWWLRLPAGGEQAVALLVRRVDGLQAHGWLSAGESLYAGPRDWVLQDGEVEGELDPRLGMVQLWNPVTVPLSRLVEFAARLRASSLRDIERLALAPETPLQLRPAPGRVGWLQSDGVGRVCGTPLGEQDPRLPYQALYRRLALLLGKPQHEAGQEAGQEGWQEGWQEARYAAAESIAASRALPPEPARHGARPRFATWRQADFWRGAATAAALLLVVGLPYLGRRQPGVVSPPPAVVAERGLAPQAGRVLFVVHFAPGTTLGMLTVWLQQAGMEVVSGPDVQQAYVLAAPAAQAAKVRRLLKGSKLVLIWSEKAP